MIIKLKQKNIEKKYKYLWINKKNTQKIFKINKKFKFIMNKLLKNYNTKIIKIQIKSLNKIM